MSFTATKKKKGGRGVTLPLRDIACRACCMGLQRSCDTTFLRLPVHVRVVSSLAFYVFSVSFSVSFRMKVGSVFGKVAGKKGTVLLLIYVLSGVCISTSQSLSEW